LLDFNKTLLFSTYLKKVLKNTKFVKNPSSGSRVVPCGKTGRQTDMTKLSLFAIFANAPNKLTIHVTPNSTDAQNYNF